METEEKKIKYRELLNSIPLLFDGIDDWVSVEANASALLKQTFPEAYFWVGFYNVCGEELHLGPFQGTPACYVIKKGKGVCGTAWQRCETIVVEDVELFPGHIACSSLSRSEIVVPVINDKNEVVAVLDIDSDTLATFDEIDKYWLEKICEALKPMLRGLTEYNKCNN